VEDWNGPGWPGGLAPMECMPNKLVVCIEEDMGWLYTRLEADALPLTAIPGFLMTLLDTEGMEGTELILGPPMEAG